MDKEAPYIGLREFNELVDKEYSDDDLIVDLESEEDERD